MSKDMNLTNFILWLSVGAVIGWFASRMAKRENMRVPVRVLNTKKM